MWIDVNVISIFVVCVVFPKYSRQEKPEDCIKGLQYWSKTVINEDGTCAPCPLHSKNCYDQPIADEKSCLDSCSGKAKPKVKPAKMTSTPILPSTPMAMLSPTTAELPREQNKNRKTLVDNNQPIWLVILVASSVFAVLGLVAAVLLVRRKFRKKAQRNVEECVALQPPVQATPSSSRIGGIPDTEEDKINGSSSLSLQEIHT